MFFCVVVAKDKSMAVNQTTHFTSNEDILSDEYGTHRNYSSFRKSTILPSQLNDDEDSNLSTNTNSNCICYLLQCIPLIHPYGPFRYFVDFVVKYDIYLVPSCLNDYKIILSMIRLWSD